MEMRRFLQPAHLPFLAQHLVMKRASLEPARLSAPVSCPDPPTKGGPDQPQEGSVTHPPKRSFWCFAPYIFCSFDGIMPTSARNDIFLAVLRGQIILAQRFLWLKIGATVKVGGCPPLPCWTGRGSDPPTPPVLEAWCLPPAPSSKKTKQPRDSPTGTSPFRCPNNCCVRSQCRGAMAGHLSRPEGESRQSSPPPRPTLCAAAANYHRLYGALVDALALKELETLVLATTYSACKALLASEKVRTSSSERTLLKNLRRRAAGV